MEDNDTEKPKTSLLLQAEQAYKRIVENIIQARERLGKSRREIAEAVGMRPSTYTDMETGRSKFNADQLIAVTQYLNIPFLNLPSESTALAIPVQDFDSLVQIIQNQSLDIAEIKELLKGIFKSPVS